MFMDEKMQGAMNWLHERATPDKDQTLGEVRPPTNKYDLMEKGDLLAMMIAAFLVIFPAVVGVLLFMALVSSILFL